MFLRFGAVAICIGLLGWLSLLVAGQELIGKNFVFDVADLTMDFPDSAGGTVNLQGFQITDNAKIIENKMKERYGELLWVSVGNPRVARYNTTGSSAPVGVALPIYPEMFEFRDDGFNIAISTLNDGHRQKLREIVKRKYDIDISVSQIVNMMLSELKCQLDFYPPTTNVKTSIFGSAKNMINYPLKVSFDAPKGSPTRVEFERKLRSYMNRGLPIDKVDLTIDCVMKSEAKTTKTNYFSISSLQISTLGITESIFGPTNTSALVTRDQMQNLASELFTKLRVYEEYQISSERFKDTFVNELINQVSTDALKYVSLEQALASLSSYNIYQDLKPDVIREDLGKVFKIESLNGKQYVKADKAYAESTSQSSAVGGSGSASGFGITLSANYAENRQKQWQIGTASVDEQLAELNKYDENQIEWEKRGEMIVPKSIKVSRLSRASFTKGITIERIFRVSVDSSFVKKFTIDPSHFQYEDHFSKILHEQNKMLSEQNDIIHFLRDSFGKSPNDALAYSAHDYITTIMPEIKSSSRLSLVPRGTILQVALSSLEQSFKSDGKGIGDYDGWVICDGRHGTPDLKGRFLVGHNQDREEYAKIGKTGGRSSVLLHESNLPEHRHHVNLQTSWEGHHSHAYKDVFWSATQCARYDPKQLSENIGSGNTDFDNIGCQMTRNTDPTGGHTHTVAGLTVWENRLVIPFDIRPEYYTVTYIMFTGVYNQKSASQTRIGI